MEQLDVAVATFVVAAPRRVADRLGARDGWPSPWPGLRLTVTEDREVEGVRWQAAGAVAGTAELWLEPVLDGTVVHWFLRGTPASGRATRAAAHHRRAWQAVVLGLKDELESGRPPGVKPTAATAED